MNPGSSPGSGSPDGSAGEPAAAGGSTAVGGGATPPGTTSAPIPDGDSRTGSQAAATAASAGVEGQRTGDEKTAVLDRKLDRSLEELDGLLIEEQQELAQKAGSPGGAGGAGGGREGGQAGGGSAGSDPERGSGGATGGGGATPPGGANDPGAATGGGVGGGGESARVPADVGDGADDDIIARQLREAAMAEEDPELREKLWQEYRDYKASVNGSAGDGGA